MNHLKAQQHKTGSSPAKAAALGRFVLFSKMFLCSVGACPWGDVFIETGSEKPDDSTCSFFALPKLPYPYWSCHTRCLKAKTWWSKTFLKLLLQRLLPLREFFPCGRRKLMALATKKYGLNPTPATRHGLQGTCSKDNTSQDQNRKCLTHKPYIYNDSLDGRTIFYLWISTGNVCSTTDLFLSQSVGHASGERATLMYSCSCAVGGGNPAFKMAPSK